MRTTLLLLPLFAVALIVPARADACSMDAGPACAPLEIAPPNGAIVPANVPAFPFASSVIDVTLERADGTALPTRWEDDSHLPRFLIPTAPLEANASYRLRWSEPCDNGAMQARTFSTSGTEPLPLHAGAITLGAVQRANLSSCGGPLEGDPGADYTFLSIGLTPSPSLAKYLATTRIEVFVDGQLRAVKAYGEVTAANVERLAWLTVTCAEGKAPQDAVGHHTIRVQADVAGEPPNVVATEVDLTCDSATETPTNGDAGASDPPSADATPKDPASAAGGCNSSRATSGASFASLAVALSLVVRARRRSSVSQ